MTTFNQISRNPRPKKVKKNRHFLFQNRPQKIAFCLNVLEMNPRKPNSAKRNIADVFWWQKPKWKLKPKCVYMKVFIPGQAKQIYSEPPLPKGKKGEKRRKRLTFPKAMFIPVKKGGRLLIQGGACPDLPRIKYKVVRQGFIKRTMEGLKIRRRARSKYGTKKLPDKFERKKRRGPFRIEIIEALKMPEGKLVDHPIKVRNKYRALYKFKKFSYK